MWVRMRLGKLLKAVRHNKTSEGTLFVLRLGVILIAGWSWVALRLAAGEAGPSAPKNGAGMSYLNDRVAEVPWSIHVLKIDRARADFELHTTLAKGMRLGLSTLTDQIKTLPADLGQPLAAINGDFWKEARRYEGDPMGLQIMRGELVSAPTHRACFWIDAAGHPHATNVISRFRVFWPNGQVTSFGLNEERANDGAVLYTSVVGASTGTRGGRELMLERVGQGAWLPLQIGQTYQARVREAREAGDTPLTPDAMVLSLGPQLLEELPAVKAGAALKISTDTYPDLSGVKVALGGGPMLVQDGKALGFSGSQPRHPRTAVGWNEKYFYFVEADGRQRGLSVGMSLPELAAYMAKLGCECAMNLDGGGSSTFWVLGQVMNSPCYGRERAMANALVLLQKPKPSSALPQPEPNDDQD
jgi:hypothetical protein